MQEKIPNSPGVALEKRDTAYPRECICTLIFSSSPRSLIDLNTRSKVYEHEISFAAFQVEGKPEMGRNLGEQREEEEGGCHPRAGGC